jgi:phosphoribosylformimino-5-aminoimidazole carboxamide ribotide isomerase
VSHIPRFTIFPAIDLRHGRCVRLERGEAEREKVYGEDPLAVAAEFAASGAGWVHVVDLDAAFGDGSNRRIITEIAAAGHLRVQAGGGLRSEADLEAVLDAGVARAVIGTAAIENPELVGRAVERWGSDRIAVGLDARGRRPAVRGWREAADADLFPLAASLAEVGVRTLIYTDIDRDGMLSGPNLETAVELAERTGVEVVVSGGISSLDDLRRVAAAQDRGIAGVILGRALYEGRVQLPEALAIGSA